MNAGSPRARVGVEVVRRDTRDPHRRVQTLHREFAVVVERDAPDGAREVEDPPPASTSPTAVRLDAFSGDLGERRGKTRRGLVPERLREHV